MLSSSASMLTILSDKFKDNALATKCKTHGRQKIMRGETSRALDFLPEIIIEPDLKRLSQLFRTLLLDISAQIDNDAPTPTTLDEYDHIELFIKNIAAKGCSELLNSDGSVRSDFLQLMGWRDLRNKIDVLELISAYVSTIYAQLGNQNVSYVFNHQQAYASLTNYLNKNQHCWIDDVLHEHGYIIREKKSPASPKSTSPAPYRIPWLAVSASIFVVSSLGYAALSIFRKSPPPPPLQESNDDVGEALRK